jgi:Zn-dependent peptidase ImmA (M78 family)
LSIDAAQHALTSDTNPSSLYEVYGLSDRATNSLAELVIDAIRSHAEVDALSQLIATPVDANLVPYRSQEEIDEEVASVLSELDYRDGRVPLSRILEVQRRRTGLDLEIRAPTPEEQRRGTLGCFDLEARKISIINCEPHEVDRQQFTIAHELGHHFLGHGDILARERFDMEDIDESGIGVHIGSKELRRLEIQANIFASSLLLPKRQFLRDMQALAVEFNLRDKGHGLIYLDGQRCNIDDHLRITQRLRVKYGASRSAITHRLETFGLLTIARPQPLKVYSWLAAFR